MSMADDAIPEVFRTRLEEILSPERFAACWESFAAAQPTAFRANGLKTSADALSAELLAEDFALTPLAWKADAFTVPAAQRRALTECAAYRAGRLYIQNPSSMVPPILLDPQPDEWILDLTAAPGSKTIQLAEMMGNAGKISAVESVRGRFFRLRDNLATHGVENVQTYLKDGTRVWRQCPEQFDRVLLDAPCSSEGQFRADQPKSWAYWSEKKIAEMSRKQRKLCYSAVQCLKPGGVLVYSTCTFAPEENEAIVDRALGQFGEALQVEDIALPFAHAEPGLDQWRGKAFAAQLQRARRIVPRKGMEGFFVCRLRKTESTA
jgi:NOL1/NOP2/sun family putative RNA methylase